MTFFSSYNLFYDAKHDFDQRFFNKWIRSCWPYFHKPIDYWLWGNLKSLVHKTAVGSVETLRQRDEQRCR